MSDDEMEIEARVPLSAEQLAMLEDPAALAFVERALAEAFAQHWRETLERHFLYGYEL